MKGSMLTECKHQNCSFLCSDNNEIMTWVERLSDGRLFTIMASHRPANDMSRLPWSQFLFGRVSEDNGMTWSPPYYLYEWPEKAGCYGPLGFKIDKDGYVHMFATHILEYKFGDSGDTSSFQGHIAYVRFDSFRGENPLYSDIPVLHRYTGSLNNFIETEQGRLVVPFSTFVEGRFVSSTIYSDDKGVNWHVSNDVCMEDGEVHAETGAIEPVVAEVAPGILIMLIRTVLNCFWYAVSYDSGASWGEPKATRIVSPNAPGVLQKLPDGRIFLAWNNGLGHPMQGVRYSVARQCLYGAVSSDGLRTIHGVRMIAKKTEGDPDVVQNTYPTVTMSDYQEVLLRHIEVDGKGGSSWKSVQGFLTLLNPDFLEETDVCDNWSQWVCDLPKYETGIRMYATEDNLAHAIVNFPFAVKGQITLNTEGELPENCRILLSDCYLDRLNFMPNRRAEGYDEVIGTPYLAISPNAVGCWNISWDDTSVTVSVNGEIVKCLSKNDSKGYNHLTVLFEGEGELLLTHFAAHSEAMNWDTGIEY